MTRARAKRKVCPVALCGADIRRDQLMCRSCWYSIKAALRAAVTRTWRRLRRHRDLEDAVSYRKAAEEAIAAAAKARDLCT